MTMYPRVMAMVTMTMDIPERTQQICSAPNRLGRTDRVAGDLAGVHPLQVVQVPENSKRVIRMIRKKRKRKT